MDRVLGVMKAYTTRVGEGRLPTEDADDRGMLHEMGREFGATTGRARRCGWFDAVATRYATMINGIDELAITNLDGLDTVDPIQVCVGYRLDGKRLEVPPSDAAQLRAASRSTRIARLEEVDREGEEILRSAAEARSLCAANLRTDRRTPDDGQRRAGARPDAVPLTHRIR